MVHSNICIHSCMMCSSKKRKKIHFFFSSACSCGFEKKNYPQLKNFKNFKILTFRFSPKYPSRSWFGNFQLWNIIFLDHFVHFMYLPAHHSQWCPILTIWNHFKYKAKYFNFFNFFTKMIKVKNLKIFMSPLQKK